MVQIHESSSSKHSYSKQALWIYFIPSNLFLLLPSISVPVDLFLFLCFQDDLEFHYVLVLQEIFIGYNQTITNDVGLASFELVLPQVCLEYHHFLFDFSLCGHISNATSAFTTENIRCLSLFNSSDSYSMTSIFIDLSVTLH
jgi:hypothetical protein